MKEIIYFLCLLISSICTSQSQLFKLIEPEDSGIDFRNNFVDTHEINPFIYENLYSGSGVAIGDINNDGLQDLYFGGNIETDKLYLNKGNLVFEEITDKSGIQKDDKWTTGVTMVDINQDGWLDIYVCKSLYDNSSEKRKNELYINNGDLSFTESAAEYGLDDSWRSQQAVFFDYDKDNDLDLFLVNQPPNPGILSDLKGKDWRFPALGCRLFRNDDGRFKDVTSAANVFDKGYGLSATTGDFNNDGWIDIYVSNDYVTPDFIYINQKDGTFKNTVHKSMGHISYFSMGVDVADINNDNLLDIITVDMVPEDNYNLKANMGGMYPEAFWKTVKNGGHYQYMINTLQLNRGVNADGLNIFSEIAQFSNTAYTDWSWSPLIADFDNDGLKDIFITNGLVRDLRNTDAIQKIYDYLQERNKDILAVKESNGKLNIWDKVSLDTMLAFHPVRKIPNYAFKNLGELRFEKKTTGWGLNLPAFSTGAAYGDLDNDGDLDLVVSNINDNAFLYENTLKESNSLRVTLKVDNESLLVGSRVEISINDLTQIYEFANSRGFYSSSENVAHFGLNTADRVDEVRVYWSDGLMSILRNVSAGSITINSKESKISNDGEPIARPYFLEIELSDLKHEENVFDDYEREVLLPHQMSTEGPRLAIGDIDADENEEFYLPGALGYAGFLDGVPSQKFTEGLSREEVGSLFFDMDNDSDLDLYVVTGGNELSPGAEAYQDILYRNESGVFRSVDLLPNNAFSGSLVINSDYDNDGDLDLFVGGRQIPGQYPSPASSFIYKNMLAENGNTSFVDVTGQVASDLNEIGMVTSAVWTDFDLDSDTDLIVVGEWLGIEIFENENGKFQRLETNLANQVGWWNHISATDLDNDGDEDYIIGNLGLNYKFKAKDSEPFIVHYDDFDGNGKKDIVLAYYNFGELYPVRGRSCSAQQIPEIKKQFQNYDTFASANLFEVYGEQALGESLTLEATNFENSFIENLGNGSFKISPLPSIAQLSPINATAFVDLNNDGYQDIIYGGNKYGSEVETPRADAGVGGVLINKGNMAFEAIEPSKSGLFLNSHVKDLQIITRNKKQYLLVASNNDRIRFFEILDKN